MQKGSDYHCLSSACADVVKFRAQAADLFAGEEQTSEANKCRLKVSTRRPLDLFSLLTCRVRHLAHVSSAFSGWLQRLDYNR